MTVTTLVIILLVLVLIGALPVWPHSENWGRGPGSVLGAVLLVLVILMLLGKV